MAITWDTVKNSFFRLAKAADARAVYRAMFAATVVLQHEDLTVDVAMDDPMVPGMSGLPLRLGITGSRVRLRVAQNATHAATLSAPVRCLVGFENGDPARPFALLADAPASAVDVVTFGVEGALELGAEGAHEALVLGSSYRAAEHAMNAGALGLSAAFDLMQAVAVGPLAPLKPGLLQAKAAIEVFEAQASTYLSGKVKTL